MVGRARGLVLEGHRRREAAERAALGDARRRAATAEAALDAYRQEEETSRKSVVDAEARYWQADAAARTAAERREGSREALIRVESRTEALHRRLAEIESAIAAAEDELGNQDADAPAPTAAEAEVGAALSRAAAAEARWQVASQALAGLDEAVMRAEEALAESRRLAGAEIAERARAGELLARATARRDQLRAELEEARADAAGAAAELDPSRAVAGAARDAASTAREAHEVSLSAIVAAQPVADAARRRASELAEKAGAMRGELEALHERAEGGGRLGSVLAAAGWSALLEGMEAPDEAWPAIEAVVGGELEQALLWRDGDLAGRLHDARGAARLVDAGSTTPSGESRRAALDAVRAATTLAEWVGSPTAAGPFAWTVLAPDVESLLAGWRGLPPGWQAVTPSGDLADGRGLLVLRGRADSTSSEAARRHGRRRELAQALEALEAEQEQSASDAARAMAGVAEAGRALEVARTRLEVAERAERDASTTLEALEVRARRAAELDAQLVAELAQLEAEEGQSPIDREATAAGDLDMLADQARLLRERRVDAATERDRSRDAWIAAQADARRIEEEQLGAQRSRSQREARRIQLEASLIEQRGMRERLVAERAELLPQADAARSDDEAVAAERAAADAERDAARAALVELERTVGAGGARLAELERNMQTATIDASRREEALAALSRERELALESLPRAEGDDPADAAAANPVPIAPDDPEVARELGQLDDESVDAELRKVRRTLSQIGSVNPFAVDEHRELSTRLEDLTTQDADLGQAIASTEEMIGRLDADIAERFNAAFAAIGERFDDFCRLLFAGGSASLTLGDGSDGEEPGGIEIVVRPPGKRLQRLAMLSGGERALTGVALLFAMLSVNPVPFCILDEVDAALDEANIGRFADALRRLADDIDFVVITHNRATVEVADTIYGVTMSDAAVSAIVSLRLADIPAEVAVG
jgi:chromosome segregation protein